VNTEHLEFKYFSFYAALRRYRTTTIIGWGVTAAGMAGFITSWGIPGAHGLLDVILAAAAIVAGLTVVHVSVMGLQSYVSVEFPPLPHDAPETDRAALEALAPVMIAVRDGGWQEAFHAIGELRAIGERWGWQPPDRRTSMRTAFQQKES
jgi:hypothetical protein